MSEQLKVGDTIWVFDVNCRVYAKDASGRSSGGPIYREHWRPRVIAGETRASWILQYRGRVPKKRNPQRPEYLITEAEIDDACWVNDYRSDIADRIQRCSNAQILRAVAELVGYTPPEAARGSDGKP